MIDGQLLRLIEIFLLCRLGAELPSEGKGVAIFNQSGGLQTAPAVVHPDAVELNPIGTVHSRICR